MISPGEIYMKCPHCGSEFQFGLKRDYTLPLFALLILFLITFIFMGIRIRGENEALKMRIKSLEKKIDYYESTLHQYQKAIEDFIQKK